MPAMPPVRRAASSWCSTYSVVIETLVQKLARPGGVAGAVVSFCTKAVLAIHAGIAASYSSCGVELEEVIGELRQGFLFLSSVAQASNCPICGSCGGLSAPSVWLRESDLLQAVK